MSGATSTPRAFTLVELLVVIVIILLLVGLAGPAFLAVRKNASRAATETGLKTIATGIEQFRSDFGYLPPLILDDPNIGPASPEWCTSLISRDDARDRLASERYHSIYSLPVYLLGVGGISPDTDSANPDRHDGVEGPGLRDPGPDRAWGGARERTTGTHRAPTSGRVYGPYLDVADSGRVREAKIEELDFVEDGNVPFGDVGPWAAMSVLVDEWDTPVRYYRAWPTTFTGSTNRSLLGAPAEIVDADALADAPNGAGEFDASRDPELARAEYVLLSAGEDRLFTPTGFAKQGEMSTGTVQDFLLLTGQRSSVLSRGLRDNIRLVR